VALAAPSSSDPGGHPELMKGTTRRTRAKARAPRGHEGDATGASDGDRIERRGKKMPTPATGDREASGTGTTRLDDSIRRKRFWARESSRILGHAARTLGVRGASRIAKAVRGAGNTRCAGARHFVRVAEVGWTHRASSAPGGRKASWSERALAWRKLEAPPDAGHEWRDGETVRG
jgi:hypothetical protein